MNYKCNIKGEIMKFSAIVVCVLLLYACSSIVEGRSQQITVNTTPSGASCVLTRLVEGKADMPSPAPHAAQNVMGQQKEQPDVKPEVLETIGSITSTPGSVVIQKTNRNINIECRKEGYGTASYTDKSDAAAATFGNILAGGIIGLGIDAANGASNKYEGNVNITMNRE
jgi:hypothetical protein